MIDIVIDDGLDESLHEAFDAPEAIVQAAIAACAAAGFAGLQPEFCIRFTSDQEIRSLNCQWRGQDKVTDVLAFPMQEPPCDFSESLGD
ncbi:MAG: rRNA maturation RNAse YbeY, partial [Mariprofundus sp.]